MAWPSVYGVEASRFRSPASTSSSNPTIVLVHDAFHAPEHLETLNAGLTSAGYRVVLPRLPSSGSEPPPNALEADVQAICRTAGPDLGSGRDLVVVMHGYSTGSIAASRLNEYSLQRPRSGQVVRLIFFAGIVVSRGESVDNVFRTDWMSTEVCCIFMPDPTGTRDSDKGVPSPGRYATSSTTNLSLLSGLHFDERAKRRRETGPTSRGQFPDQSSIARMERGALSLRGAAVEQRRLARIPAPFCAEIAERQPAHGRQRDEQWT
nr:hypothetical protein CFP56_11521 [Quercus suber]